ncbi:MAG TPA: hypothetical protein VKV95_14385 [Terriglobia bacterium]|nr:hypothetical protein [Terriglobia bacterium]
MHGLRIKGKKVKKGKRMIKGRGWELVKGKGRKTTFHASLLDSFNFADVRIAVFSVPKQ